ncbi:MAG: putative lipase [Candidatus Cardinium sp.]|uniref:alpha/beta hydrolase n=1 Tax=Cardinium endosymbiont of Dermatophagoides farinae TaxID=2597823 RepID=UPI00118229FF|nr:hypothetical protein [Cardinium endosymbiont of Dermatophagoides farinae]TSJ80855.1 hypothetical protein FPG78_02240 [Cardinium endosymbiont of Dermatophagoides farinae]UWW96860.1 MAG: putative lipase [Candidatus Cardinium sp.]
MHKSSDTQHEDELDPSLDKPIEEVVEHQSKAENPTKLNHQKTSAPLYKPHLVLLHGLMMNVEEEDALKEKMEQKYGGNVVVIQPKCREGLKSLYLSIDVQAEKVVEEIKTELRNLYPQYSEEALKAISIDIFGYSQGGLVACMIAIKHSKELYINSLTLCHAPLSGTYVLENTKSDIKKLRESLRPGMEAIGCKSKFLENLEVDLAIKLLNGSLSDLGGKLKGVSDMCIGSKVCKRIKEFIREE